MTSSDTSERDWPVAKNDAAWARGFALTGASLRRNIRERFTEPAALRGSYRRAQPTPLYTLPQDQTGVADRGRRLVRGVYKFGEQSIEATPQTIWSAEPPSRGWLAELHSFNWLADLAALGRPAARKLAVDLTVSWLDRAARYDPVVWAPVVAAERLRAWLTSSDIMPLDSENGAKLTRSAVAHLDWLQRRGAEARPGLPAILVGVAIVEASISLESTATRYELAAARLDQILEVSLLEDGGVVGRSPLDALIALEQLGLMLVRCDEAGAPASAAMRDAPNRLGRALRFFRAADGGLPVFHGSYEAADGRLDAALTRYKLPAEPARELPQSGYVKMVGGRVAVMVDAASASTVAPDRAHASALSFELTSGRRRVVVNSGSGEHLANEWTRSCRAAPAHTTITLEGQSFVTETPTQDAFNGDDAIGLAGPLTVTCDRKEERNGVWVLASHDGYIEEFGALVTRRLFLSAEGGDFRGEDTVRAEGAAASKVQQRRLAKLPRSQREKGFAAEARFHLHPELSAALVADGEAATLRLPHGEVWVMRQAGGLLSIEESVYLGRWGRPEKTSALLIRFDVGEDGGRVRWAFRRVGDLDQLPKDIDALLPPPGAPEDVLFGARGEREPATLPSAPPKRR
ncbi:MAG: heparinase II/III family protein [Neomegalonema sp.]|nr:heparinase II/III family protein [Neomegalonema sp.]